MTSAGPRRPLLDVHQLGMRHTGNETWARNVVAALERRDGNTHYALPDLAELPPDARARGHQVGGSSARRLLLDLPRVARQVRPTVIAAQYTLPLTRVPGVVVVHDLSFEDPRASQWLSRGEILRYRATIRASVQRAKVVIVSSEFTRMSMLRHYSLPAERIRVAPCALDERLGAALAKARTTSAEAVGGEGEPYVLVVGNLLPRKNVLTVGRAIARLRDAGATVALRLVGKQPAIGAQSLEMLRELLGPGLQTRGYVEEEELARQYAGAAVVAFPSLYEGFGFPLLEAMAAGVPVVASRATSLPEVGGDAVLLVDPDDEAAWSSALAHALFDRDARARLVALGDYRVQHYSWDRTAALLQEAFDDAAFD